ncbi:CobW family GTP-binding protein [Candidatus Pyrohabitans sp.]
MKVTVISGFLGAGKTTMIRRIISNADSSLAVIVNEFGDVGIDRELVSSSGKLEVAELASGCVCCTLRAELSETLTELKERFSPERVLLEPSGVSMTSSIVEALQEPHLEGIAELEGVISVIDASAFSELYPLESFQRLYRDAIANASAVVINKMDIASEEDVRRVERTVKEINPSGVVLRSSFGEVELPKKLPGVEVRVSDGVHLLFDSFSAKPKAMSTRRTEELFDRLKRGEFGRVIRAKGIFRAGGKSWYYDLSSGRVSRERLASNAEPSFVAIGSGLRKDALKKVLEA